MAVEMRFTTDCEVAALATAACVPWEKARDALGWRELPLGAENPVFGNPVSVSLAIERLGFKAVNRTCNDLIKGIAAKNKTLVLVHSLSSPTLVQHWVVFSDVNQHLITFHWGDGTQRSFPHAHFLELFTRGTPNAAWEVGPKECQISRLQQLLNWFKNLFRKR